MGDGGKPVLALDGVDDPQGFILGAAACAVGNGAVIRPRLDQGGDGFLQKSAIAFIGFWRKHFKRNHRPITGNPACVNVTDERHRLRTWLNPGEMPSGSLREARVPSRRGAWARRTGQPS